MVLYLLVYGTFLYSQYNLINYNVTDGLPSPETYFIYQDHDGYIWICTDRGLSRYNGYEFENFSTNDGLTYNTVFRVYEDAEHNLWFTCYDGSITIYSYHDKSFKPFWGNEYIMSTLKSRTWLTFIGFKENEIVCGTSGGRDKYSNQHFRINLQDSTVTSFTINNPGLIEYNNIFFDILSVTNNLITANEYHKDNYTISSNKIPKIKQPVVYISLHDDEIIYCTSQNITISNKKDTISINVDGRISGALKDREGNHWVSTLKSGVFKIPSIDFKLYQLTNPLVDGDRPSSISLQKGKLFIETEYLSIYEFDHEMMLFKELGTTSEKYESTIIFTPTDSVFSLKYSLSPLNSDIKNKPEYWWFSNRFNSNKGETDLTKYYNQKRKRLIALHQLGDNTYFSTFKRLYLAYKNDTIIDCTEKYNVANTSVRTITSTQDSVLVLGTTGQGVILINNDQKISIRESDGLISDLVEDVIIEQNGVLWCGTNKGISKIELREDNLGNLAIDKITNMSYNDGLGGTYIRELLSSKNTIWALSESGLTEFNSDIILKKKTTPLVHILSLKQGGVEFEPGSIFKNNENDLSINYIGISTNKPISQDFYQYRLESNDLPSNWISTNNRSVSFTQLAPGDYRFSVTAKAENGEWAEPKQISFTIQPHWTALLWVRSIFVLMSIGVLYFLYQRDVKRKSVSLKRQLVEEQLQNRLKSAELEVLRGQMNPHFIYNSLNSVQRYLKEEKTVDANEFIGSLSKLLRLGLQHSRSAFIGLKEEIEFVTNFLKVETHRTPDRFTFDFEIDNKLDTDICIPSFMIQPICENIIKHAYAGSLVNIKIGFMYNTEKSIKVTISDNGVGYINTRSRTKKNNPSLGLQILSQRIELFKKQNLEANYKIGPLNFKTRNGTSIQLILPIE